MVMAMAVLVAWLVRRMRDQAEELAERHSELVQRRSEAAQSAIVDERLRISRELHDVVAHHITAMTVHAGGASRALKTNVEAAESSLSQIASSGRDAINDLQRMLGFLRGQSEPEQEPRSPAPSLRHLDRLLSSFGDDLDVETCVTGPIESLPASVDLSAYRIVQEALTNIVKHSTAASARVELQVGNDTTTIDVENAGDLVPAINGDGTGHGLIGMRERAVLHGGSLETGPNRTGGWHVHAVLRHGTGE